MKVLVRRGLAVGLLSTAMIVGSCGGDDACACHYPGDDSPNAQEPDDGPVIATNRNRGEFDPAAAPAGVLSLQRGCLVFEGAVPLWPYGTRWDDATSSVRVPDWSAGVRIGRRVTLGGGFFKFPDERPAWLPRPAYRDAAACLDRLDRLDRVRTVFLVARGEPIG